MGKNYGFFMYKLRQPPQTFVCCPPFVMSGSEGDKIEHKIVVVGRQLAFVNHKFAEPIGNHERSHTRLRGFFGGGGNAGLFEFPISIGVPWD